MSDFREIFDRLKQYFNLTTDKAVAGKIGLNYETMKSWSTRKKVVVETLAEKLAGEPINLNWLFRGIGEPKIGESERMLGDISKMAWALNADLDADLLHKITSDEKLTELVTLLPFATEEFISQVLDRLRKFRDLSEI